MILQQVMAGQEEALWPLVDERIEEANLGTRLDPGYAKILISQNLVAKTIDAFTDDLANPNCVLIISYGRLSILVEDCAIMSILHVSKAMRKKDPVASLVLGKSMIHIAEAQARARKCYSLRGSSLVWRGGADISPFFWSQGFELQSHEFVKLLTHQ